MEESASAAINDMEELRRLKELLKEKDKTIEEKDKIYKMIDEVANKIIDASLLGALKKKGGYPLMVDRTLSGAHFSKTHATAKIVGHDSKQSFSSLAESKLGRENFDEMWKAGFSPINTQSMSVLDCDSLSETQSKVVQILDSVIRGLGLENVIGIARNRTLAGSECDVLLVYLPNRLPFAPIEVKKPTESDHKKIFYGEGNDHPVAGQLFDQCSSVKLFGYSRVFGLLTTWNYWRLVCTSKDDTDDDSSRKYRDDVAFLASHCTDCSNEKSTTTSPPTMPVEFKETDDDNDGSSSGPGRTLYAYDVVPTVNQEVKDSGEEIVSLIAVFVLKACSALAELIRSKNDPRALVITQNMPCRILEPNKDGNIFAFGTATLEECNLQKFPAESTTLHVIHHLGSGGFGECCIAVSELGNSGCVVKFFRYEDDRSKKVEDEKDNWNRAYKDRAIPSCYSLTGPRGPYLVMPFLAPITLEDRSTFLKNGRIKKALEDFAKSGLVHLDICWRHFGLWGEDLFLCDLGKVREANNQNEIEQWVQNSIEYLRDRGGSPSPPKKRMRSENGTEIHGNI